MPYTVAKSDQCPASRPWACIKTGDGKVMGCHQSKQDAQQQLAALMATEGTTMSRHDERAVSGGNFDLGDRKETWDGGAAEKSYDLPTDANAYMWRDPNGDPATRAAYKLPFVSKSGGKHAVWNAINAIAAVIQGGRGGHSIPSSDIAGIKRKVESYYAKARKKYDDPSIEVPWASSASISEPLRFAVAPLTHLDVRDAADSHGFWTMSGYAAVFNQTTTLYDGKLIQLTESIAPSAFDRVLSDQPLDSPDGVVHFNLGHDMNRSVAATDVPAGQPGSLQLRTDDHGLFFLAKVPADDPDGVAMAAKMRSGVLRQASFAFTVGDSETTYTEADDGPNVEHRTIIDMKHLYDVCATPQGAYAQTVSGLRSLAAALGQPHQGDPYPVSPRDTGSSSAPRGDDDSDYEAELEAAAAKFATSVAHWRSVRRPQLPDRRSSNAR